MPASIAFDVTRLFIGPLSPTPRGIDRVDFVLARHYFDDPAIDCLGVLPTPWGMRVYDRDRVRRGLDRLERLWSETGGVDGDPVWRDLCARLRKVGAAEPVSPLGGRLGVAAQGRRMMSLLTATGFAFGRPVRRAVPRGAVYLNIGHVGLAVPLFLRWLDQRPDVKPVFMLHDVIPLEAPEFVAPAASRHHATMVASTAKYAQGLIVTTDHARSTVTAALETRGRTGLATFAHPLPLAEVFDQPEDPPEALDGVSYFVVCGAIEPRKNHALLLEVWKRLAARPGAPVPDLVVVGTPGWRGREILDALCRCTATSGHIHIVTGLSSPALKRLMIGSAGLLMPSLAEGFGLPLVEAAELGVPVLASDIPAHREVMGSTGVLIDPLDCSAWVAAISARLSAPRAAAHPAPLHGRVSRHAYAEALRAFLRRVAGGDAAGERP